MQLKLKKILQGYQAFRNKYVHGDQAIMQTLSDNGQQPEVMVVACCDSRVDPALILQCDPGDLFVVRNVANIVPPYENDAAHHGTSAALEFGVCYLNVKHLILLGHSQCGGIQSLLSHDKKEDDFITNWVSQITTGNIKYLNADDCAKSALNQSYQNCLTFPWIKERLDQDVLAIHLWFFDIQRGEIFTYSEKDREYRRLESEEVS